MDNPLYWDSTFEIARTLIRNFPNINFDEVSLKDVFEKTIKLENFLDDPELANDEILAAIFQEWYEESNPL